MEQGYGAGLIIVPAPEAMGTYSTKEKKDSFVIKMRLKRSQLTHHKYPWVDTTPIVDNLTYQN